MFLLTLNTPSKARWELKAKARGWTDREAAYWRVKSIFIRLLLDIWVYMLILPFLRGWYGVEKYTIYRDLFIELMNYNIILPDWLFGWITTGIYSAIVGYVLLRHRNTLGQSLTKYF